VDRGDWFGGGVRVAHRPGSVDVRFAQVEGVLKQADVIGPVGFGAEDDFDDVETPPDGGIVEQPQVVERGFAQVLLFLAIHGFAGHAEFFAFAGFDFDEDEPLAIATDEVNFSRPAFESRDKNFVAAFFEELGGEFFAAFAQLNFRGGTLRLGSEPIPGHGARGRRIGGGAARRRIAAARRGGRRCRSLCVGQNGNAGIARAVPA